MWSSSPSSHVHSAQWAPRASLEGSAGVAQWQSPSLPSWSCGFDSRRPLQVSARFFASGQTAGPLCNWQRPPTENSGHASSRSRFRPSLSALRRRSTSCSSLMKAMASSRSKAHRPRVGYGNRAPLGFQFGVSVHGLSLPHRCVAPSDGIDYVHGFGKACLVAHDGWHFHIQCGGSVSPPNA